MKKQVHSWIILVCALVWNSISFGQKDNVHYTALYQPDTRIYVALHHNRTIGLGAQFFGVSIENKTADKLRIELEYTAHMTCGQVITRKIGFGDGLLIQPGTTIGAEGFWDTDNTSFDAGNSRNSECMKSPNKSKKIGENEYTAIERVSFRLIRITNVSEQERAEAEKQKAKNLIQDGDSKLYKNDFDGAIADYKEALNIDPTNQVAKDKIAAAEKKKKEFEEKEAANKKKKEAEDAIKRGDEKLANGDLTGAEAEYKEAERLDPTNSNVTARKQELDSKKKETEKAKETETKKQEEADAKKKDEEVQKKQQELEEKEKAEETARQKAIEEEKARQQAEKERLERQNQYYQEKQQQRDANTDLAVGSAVELLLLHIKLGQIIYGNLDTDRYGSLFSNDNWRFTMQTGYSITTMPMIFNSFFEDYDGNDYSYTTESVDMQSGTLDLNGGMELWPMYGKQFGFEFHGQGGAGHGFLLQQFTWFGQGGAKAYLGFEKMKLYGEYTIGFRTISKVAWIDPQELGSGKLKYNFHRIFTGLRFSIPAEVESKGTNITVGPLFELQDFRNMNYFNPILVRWNNGFKAEIDIENRLNIFAEFFMNYRRSGEIEETYEQKFKATGTYFRVGVLRNFDFFGESPYAHADPNINRIKEKSAFTGISFLNPSFNWLTDKNKMNSMKKVQLGVNVAFEQDIRLFSNINFMTGAIFAINGGGTSYNGVEEVSFKSHSIAVPLGLRLYLENIPRPYKRWISGAIKNDFSLFNSTDGFTDVSSKRYTRSLSFGGGVDYMLGANTLARIGLNLDYGTSSIFSEKTIDLRKRSISLQAGFIF